METDIGTPRQRSQPHRVGKIGCIALRGEADHAVQRPRVQVMPAQTPGNNPADRAFARSGRSIDGEYGNVGVDGQVLQRN
jgi:hypothetical protein